jgi:hypothetical protein
MKSCLSIAVLACTVTMSLTANAQEWLRDRRYREGVGIRAGNLELHPGVAAEAGYDSNYLQRADSENPLAFWRFRITPHLSLSTLGPQRRGPDAEPASVEFSASVAATGELLVAAEGSSEAETAAENQRDVSLDASFNAGFFPKGRFGGDVYGNFRRATEPSNQVDEDLSFDRDALRLGAGAIWRPGGGVFDWRLGYEFRWNHFENSGYRELDNVHHYLKTRNRWRFLPRTALLHESQLGVVRYTESRGTDALPNYQELRTQLGVNGLVTRHFGLLAMAGWGAAIFDEAPGPADDFDSVIGHAQLTWFVLAQPDLPNPAATLGLSSAAVGYTRTFSQNYLSTYYVRDRGYLTLSYFFAGRVLAQLEGGYSFITLPAVRNRETGVAVYPTDGSDWYQHRVDAVAFAEYRFADSFGLNATFRYDTSLTDNEIPLGPGGGTDDLSFERYQAFLGLRWFM